MQRRPIDEIRYQLTLPVVGRDQPDFWGEDTFDPWEPFERSLYGSYSSEFDDMAITVLENILHQRWGRDHGESLAHEVFREILCNAGLCDYGTSPRGCFPDWGSGFADVLPLYLQKWKQYRAVEWGDEA